jgi:transposase
MPEAHRQVMGWDAERLLDWAQKIGTNTRAVIDNLLNQRTHPQQSYRACLGVLRMERDYGRERLEAACIRALTINAASYRSISSILKNGLDKQNQIKESQVAITHSEVRGSKYFH